MTCRGERLSRATNRYPAAGNRVSEDAVEVDTGGDSLRADLLAKMHRALRRPSSLLRIRPPLQIIFRFGGVLRARTWRRPPSAGFDLPHP
jgi:hypothetical protein